MAVSVYFLNMVLFISLNHFQEVNTITALKGSTVQLTCPYKTNGIGTLDWSFRSTTSSGFITYTNNEILSPSLPSELKKRLTVTGNNVIGEYHLKISDTQNGDQGMYECLDGSRGSRKTVNLTLITAVMPFNVTIKNTEPDNSLHGTEGQTIHIECMAIGGEPQPDVKLLITGKVISAGKQSVQHTISAVRSHDGQTIICKAGYESISNFPLNDSANIYLNLKPLSPTFKNKTATTEERIPLVISCTSHGSRPEAILIWEIGHNSTNVTSNSTQTKVYNSTSNTFTVTSTLKYPVDRTYNGHPIKCEARNIATSNKGVSSSQLLDIKYSPIVTVENMIFLQTDLIRNIQCRANGNPDTATYFTCYHKSFYNVFIRELNIAQDGLVLLPKLPLDIVYQDSGIYTCTAGNGIIDNYGLEKQQGHGSVKIHAQPVFSKDNKQNGVVGEIGKNCHLIVFVYSEPKYTSISWYKNRTQVTLSAKYKILDEITIVKADFHGKEVQLDGYKLALVINSLGTEDASLYRLKLSNGIGNSVEHKMFLEIGDKPQTPMNFTVISVGDTSITIHWEPAEDGGFKQTFYVEYKVLSLTSWNRKEMPIMDQTDKGQTYDLTGLQSSNHYELRMYANNRINKSLPTGVIIAQTTSIGVKTDFLHSTSIIILAVGSTCTVFTIIAWLIIGSFRYRRRTTVKVKRSQETAVLPTDRTTRSIKDSPQQSGQTYDEITDSVQSKKDKETNVKETSFTTYEPLTLKDKPSVYSELN